MIKPEAKVEFGSATQEELNALDHILKSNGYLVAGFAAYVVKEFVVPPDYIDTDAQVHVLMCNAADVALNLVRSHESGEWPDETDWMHRDFFAVQAPGFLEANVNENPPKVPAVDNGWTPPGGHL